MVGQNFSVHKSWKFKFQPKVINLFSFMWQMQYRIVFLSTKTLKSNFLNCYIYNEALTRFCLVNRSSVFGASLLYYSSIKNTFQVKLKRKSLCSRVKQSIKIFVLEKISPRNAFNQGKVFFNRLVKQKFASFQGSPLKYLLTKTVIDNTANH